MKTKITLVCVLALLSIAGQALAEATLPSVTGIEAHSENGTVTVEWNPVTSDPIAYYRVYMSGQSILDNNGLYDDFEVTDGDNTTLTFNPPQGMGELFIAVIAVGRGGMESEFFVEEASVLVTEAESVPSSSTSSSYEEEPEQGVSAGISPTTLKLLKATVPSPKEILVEFSASITVEPVLAPEGLKITKSDGSSLQITSITIISDVITIHTTMQERGMVYNVQFSEPFVGTYGQPLDAEDRSIFVTGHAEGAMPQATQSSVTNISSDPTSPPDIQNSTLLPEVQKNGSYTVTMEWDTATLPDDLYGIVVYQTRDGVTFGPPSVLPVNIRGVQIHDVTPGFYGLFVQTMNVLGYVSPGVFQYATLPASIPAGGSAKP